MIGGLLDINGDFIAFSSSSSTISDGNINISGDWATNLSSNLLLGGTVTFDGNSNQSLSSNGAFSDLTINNSSGYVSAQNDLTINGNLTINSGGNFDIGAENANLILKGDFINSGTFTTSGETVTFDGSGSHTSSGIFDPSIDIIINKSSTAGSITFNGDCSFNEFTLNYGKAVIGTNTINTNNTVTISSGTVLEIGTGIFHSDGTFNCNGDIDFTGSGKLILSGSVTSLGTLDNNMGTVEYDGSIQNVVSDSYYNLEIDQSGIKTAQGNVDVLNNLTIKSVATYNGASHETEVSGFSDINGTLKLSSGIFDANTLLTLLVELLILVGMEP